MKLALITARPKIAKKSTNLKIMESYLKKNTADCFIFGELFLTGYRCKDEFRNLAESLDGPAITNLTKLAQKHQCYIIFGMPLKNPEISGLIHNAAILIHPNEKVDHYDKWFLPNFVERSIYAQRSPIKFWRNWGSFSLLTIIYLTFPSL